MFSHGRNQRETQWGFLDLLIYLLFGWLGNWWAGLVWDLGCSCSFFFFFFCLFVFVGGRVGSLDVKLFVKDTPLWSHFSEKRTQPLKSSKKVVVLVEPKCDFGGVSCALMLIFLPY